MTATRCVDPASIEDASVLIAGCGSVGSYVAAHLASAGVRRLILVDRDLVERQNLRRHLADRRQIGDRKVDAVARQLMLRFEGLQLQREYLCLLKSTARLRHLLDTATVCVVAVDREAPKYLIDRIARHFGTPVVFAGVYGAGRGVEIVLQSRHHATRCYGCSAAAVGRSGVEVEEATHDRAGGYASVAPQPVDLPWREAHLVSITPAAALAASFTLALLNEQLGNSEALSSLRGCGNSVWQMFFHSDMEQLAWRLNPLPVESNPDCPQCGRQAMSLDWEDTVALLIEQHPE